MHVNKIRVMQMVLLRVIVVFFYINSAFGQDNSKELIVIFKKDISRTQIRQFLEEYRLEELHGFKIDDSQGSCMLVRGRFYSVDDICKRINEDTRVVACFPNVNVTLQDVIRQMAEWNANYWFQEAAFYMDEFFKTYKEINPAEVTIVYLDSGFLEPGHPLVQKLIDQNRLINLTIDENKGYGLDVASPLDYSQLRTAVSDSAGGYTYDDLEPEDITGHGTQGALIGLTFAPGCKVLPIRFDNKDGGDLYQMLLGLNQLRRLIDNHSAGIDGKIVLNMSIKVPSGLKDSAYTTIDKTFLEPLYERGVIMLAAGNNSGQTGNPFPASSDMVIGIEAEEVNDRRGVDILAPSMVTVPNWPDSLDVSFNPSASSSFATFMTSALTARILQIAPNLTVDEMKIIFKSDSIYNGLHALIDGNTLPDSGPSQIDALTATRLAVVYSGYKDICQGIEYSDNSLLEQGIQKLSFDRGAPVRLSEITQDSVKEYLFNQYLDKSEYSSYTEINSPIAVFDPGLTCDSVYDNFM